MMDSPFGSNSFFAAPCDGACEHDDEFSYESIDFIKLAKDLDGSKFGSFSNDQRFDYEEYKSLKYMWFKSDDGADVKFYLNTEVVYTDSNGKQVSIPASSEMNKVKCCINPFPYPRITINPSRRTYGVSYHYKDVQVFERPVLSTGDNPNDFAIDDKYVAIKLRFVRAEHLFYFLDVTNRGNAKPKFAQIIFNKFQDAFSRASESPSDLNILYRDAPDFVLQMRGEAPGGKEALWNDLVKLLDYDDSGFWSFVKDSSNAVINLIKGFKDTRFLYDKFYADPALVKRIYYNMDESSEINGSMVPNSTAFSSLLTAICYDNYDRLSLTSEDFIIGPGYKLDSNILQRNDKYDDKIFLQQFLVSTRVVTRESHNALLDLSFESQDEETFLVEDGRGLYYHPLQMVTLVDEVSGVTRLVPALFIKDIADQAEWAEVMKMVRLGTNILVAALSLATLLSGPGAFLFALSAIDLSLAATDIVVAAVEEDLMKTEDGREFLRIWNQVYLIGGIATASPLLVKGVFTVSARLLRTPIAETTKNFVRSVLMSVILRIEIANFNKATVTILDYAQVSKLFRSSHIKILQELEEAGLVFVKDTLSVGNAVQDRLTLLHRGEVLVTGTVDEVKQVISRVFKPKGARMIELLDRLLEIRTISDDVLKHADEGDFALPGNPKVSTQPGKMTGGGHGQSNIDKLNSLSREFEIVYRYRNGVRIGHIKQISDKNKKSGVGQSWFPESWDAEKIRRAGEYVLARNFKRFIESHEGVRVYDNFEGVRVGIVKTDGRVGSVFPDNAMQPFPGSNVLQIYKRK
jgi:hypothetical protein